ncbi:NAD-P-binding protein [Trametes meyenii]|nr:NAD-P-binding protein [Trametes meyenii]
MPLYAIIGASRGIGLEFVRQIAAQSDNQVFAVARNTNYPLLRALAEEHKNVHLIQGDVVDHHSLEYAAHTVAQVSGGSLDVLIHNAARTDGPQTMKGYSDYKDLDELDEDFISAFKVNTLGVIHGITAFLPLLRKGATKKIVTISSEAASLGSTLRNSMAPGVAYGTTKAATVMVATKYAVALKDEGFIVISLDPGVVDTAATATSLPEGFTFQMAGDMVGKEVQTPAQSVARQLMVIENLTPEQNGAFIHFNGEPVI